MACIESKHRLDRGLSRSVFIVIADTIARDHHRGLTRGPGSGVAWRGNRPVRGGSGATQSSLYSFHGIHDAQCCWLNLVCSLGVLTRSIVSLFGSRGVWISLHPPHEAPGTLNTMRCFLYLLCGWRYVVEETRRRLLSDYQLLFLTLKL